MAGNDRAEKILGMLAKSPDDPFLLYALAMEKKKSDTGEALRLLRRVTQLDPSQCYAYFQLGQTHELEGDTEAAKGAYREGIVAAERYGDQHAKQEIAGALSMIEMD
jgi:predicted TPR repeat methyltransferase